MKNTSNAHTWGPTWMRWIGALSWSHRAGKSPQLNGTAERGRACVCEWSSSVVGLSPVWRRLLSELASPPVGGACLVSIDLGAVSHPVNWWRCCCCYCCCPWQPTVALLRPVDSQLTPYAPVTTTIRLRFDGRSTADQRSLSSRRCNPLAAVTLIYLFIYLFIYTPQCSSPVVRSSIGHGAVEMQSNGRRTTIVSNSSRGCNHRLTYVTAVL